MVIYGTSLYHPIVIGEMFKTYFLLSFSQTTKSGLARNIDEYVPITTPIIKAKTKLFIVSPPKKYSDERTRSVVTEV